jgi:hypothetical protein
MKRPRLSSLVRLRFGSLGLFERSPQISNNDVVYRVTEVLLDLRDRLRLLFDDRELASADLNAHAGGRVEVCSHRTTMSAGLN